MKLRHVWIVLLAAILMAAHAPAQEDYFLTNRVTLFQINGGWTEPGTDSDVYDSFEDWLTFSRDDLDGAMWSFNIYRQFNEILALGGGWSFYSETVPSEDRDYVFEDGSPILQDTQLETTWFGVTFQITPFGAGTRYGTRAWAPRLFVPYIQTGLGLVGWDFNQNGEFVDVDTLEIFVDSFTDDGLAMAVRLGFGCRINLHKNVDLDFNYMRTEAEDDLESDFIGFGELDLSSETASMGIIIRI